MRERLRSLEASVTESRAVESARERAETAESAAAAEATLAKGATEKARKLAASLLEAEEKALTLREKRLTLG